MQNLTDKLIDILSVFADLQNNTLREMDNALLEQTRYRSEVQEFRTDLIQIRAEFQSLHNDVSKIAMILSTPLDQRYEFAKSLYEQEFEELEKNFDNP
jgi:hypothetical protein